MKFCLENHGWSNIYMYVPTEDVPELYLMILDVLHDDGRVDIKRGPIEMIYSDLFLGHESSVYGGGIYRVPWLSRAKICSFLKDCDYYFMDE